MAEYLVLVDDATKKFTKMIPVTALPHKTYTNIAGVDYVDGAAIPNEAEVDAKNAAILTDALAQADTKDAAILTGALAQAGGTLTTAGDMLTFTPTGGAAPSSVALNAGGTLSGPVAGVITFTPADGSAASTANVVPAATDLDFSVVPVDTTCIAYAACP